MPAAPTAPSSPRSVPRIPVAETARVIRWELAVVLGLSLGRSAVYAVVDLADKLTRAPLAGQTTVLNAPRDDRWAFDLAYQLLDIAFALVPAALVLHLLWLHGRRPFRALGLDLRRPVTDLAWGLGLFLAIGVGTVGVYTAGRALGLTTAIVGTGLGDAWYAVPVLLLSAARHALVEEVIVGAWLIDRLAALQRLRTPSASVPGEDGPLLPPRLAPVLLAAALLRGSYHLYQGVGPGIGNALMGVVFVLALTRTRRAMPLVIAHLFLDAAAFVGYPLLHAWGLLG